MEVLTIFCVGKLTRMGVEGLSVFLLRVIHHIHITYYFESTGCPVKRPNFQILKVS